MSRTRTTWFVFTLCLALAAAVMVWMSHTALRLERSEGRAVRQAENERLALWRMDSVVLPLIAQENARPPRDYRPFYEAQNAYSRQFSKVKPGDIRVASPLLTFESPYILVHFQQSPDGKLTSPQVPTDDYRDLAVAEYTTPERIEKSYVCLQQADAELSWNRLNAVCCPAPPETESTETAFQTDTLPSHAAQLEQEKSNAAPQQPANAAPLNQLPREITGNAIEDTIVQNSRRQNRTRSLKEFKQRANTGRQSFFNNQAQIPAPAVGPAKGGDLTARHGPMICVWIDDTLCLAREATIDGQSFIQGCLLDWPAIQAGLTSDVTDLLPAAKLIPVRTRESRNDQPLMLASLPAMLDPGAAQSEPLPWLTPIRFSLLIAWTGLLLAAIAVAALLAAAVRLSERRGAFVSAVTHELRTPLTTFRMYTEMLADGVVPTEEKRQTYLQTLRVEAERLRHLVENVLSYSRLEGGPAGNARDRVELPVLLSGVEQSLAELARRNDMQLVILETPDDAPTAIADAAAVERIVFNLVDNACKYAGDGTNRRIEVSALREGRRVEIRVRDYGAGISKKSARRLFRPFSKSATEAAHSAPGVGLGLALCRRLARSMNGDLVIDHAVAHGACFVLTLPAA